MPYGLYNTGNLLLKEVPIEEAKEYLEEENYNEFKILANNYIEDCRPR